MIFKTKNGEGPQQEIGCHSKKAFRNFIQQLSINFVYGGIMQRLPSANGLYIQWWRKLFDWFV